MIGPSDDQAPPSRHPACEIGEHPLVNHLCLECALDRAAARILELEAKLEELVHQLARR